MENQLAKNIKALREKLGLTQAELAKQLEINPKSLGSYEQGIAEPKVSTLLLLSNFFRISIEELITGKTFTSLSDSSSSPQDPTTAMDLQNQLEAAQKEIIGLKAQVELLKELLGKR